MATARCICSVGCMDFGQPTPTPSRVARLPLRLVAATVVVVALAAISIVCWRDTRTELVLVGGLNPMQLTVIVCGIVSLGLGILVLSVTNQVAIARRRTGGVAMFLTVFVVVMLWAVLALALLIAGSLTSIHSYTRVSDPSADTTLIVAASRVGDISLSLYSGQGLEFTHVSVALPAPEGAFNPFAAGQFSLVERNGAMELSYPLRDGGVPTLVTIPSL